MGIGKSLTKIVAPIVMASALAFGVPKDAKAEISDIYAVYGLQGSFNFYSTPAFKIQSMPEYIRKVPAHHDDGGRQLPPIKDIGEADFTDLRLVDGRIGVGINDKKRFELSTGINFGLDMTGRGRELNERNYVDFPGEWVEGWGQALTYYGVYPKPSFFAGAFARGNLYNVLFLDYSVDFSNKIIGVQNGWDRWAELEPKDTYLANVGVLNHTLGISVDALLLGIAIKDSIKYKENIFSLLGSGESYSPVSFKLSFNTKIPQVLYRSTLAQEMGVTFLKNSSFSIIAEVKGMKDFVRK
jgi:hypothetical protein